MARYDRNSVLLAKIEGTYGTDSVPVVGTDAMLISNLDVNPYNAQNVPRDLIRAYLGGSEHLVGSGYVELSFDIELAASGTAGTAPAYAPLLRACGFAETLDGIIKVTYDPVTPVADSVTVYYFDDGTRHIATGCRGDVTFKLNSQGRPVMTFRLFGLYGGVSATAAGSPVYTGFVTPLVATDANTAQLILGGTYATTPAITGGTAYTSQGLEFGMGNAVEFVPLIGEESVDVTQRELTGRIALDLTPAQEVTQMGNVLANTTQSIGIIHGTTGGNKVLLFIGKAQLLNPQKVSVQGRRLIGFDIRGVPNAGNDECKVVLF